MKPKKIGMFYVIKTQFQYAPIHTLFLGTEAVTTGMIPAIRIFILAGTLDSLLSFISGSGSILGVALYSALLLTIVVYQIVISKFRQFVRIKTINRLRNTYSIDIQSRKANFKYKYFENPKTCDLIFRVCNAPEDSLSSSFKCIFRLVRVITSVLSIILAFATQVWWVAVVMTLVAIPLLLVANAAGKQNYEIQRKVSKLKRKYQYLSEDVLSGRDAAAERQLFGYSTKLNNIWMDTYNEAADAEINANGIWLFRQGIGSVSTTLVSVVTMFLLIYPAATGKITVGMYISLITSLNQLTFFLGARLTEAVNAISWVKEFLVDMTDFYNLELLDGANDLPASPALNFETVEFRSVTFTYPGTERKILDSLSFTINRGMHYAFVGVNGAGKTTITKLLTGLYDEFEGDILIDGVSIKTMPMSLKKSLCSVVYQDFSRFWASFKDNILLGDIRNMNTDEGKKKMLEACQQMELGETIETLENGMDTVLGKIDEKGRDLSSGQWQRMAIARALVSDAPIRILDEPTASLDPISESSVYHQFEKMSQNKTTIFISHRLASTQLADVIYVIGDGKVLEKGNHNELMELSGIYSYMYLKQSGWYK